MPFKISPKTLEATRDTAKANAQEGRGIDLLGRLRREESLSDEELATIFLSPEIKTSELIDLAKEMREPHALEIETFCPLYISNECDAECLMCGMRNFNNSLIRQTADEGTIKDQLKILGHRGIRGVALLTGEYRHGKMRKEMLNRTSIATRDALTSQFEHILINVGSIEEEEYEPLLHGVPRLDDGSVSPHITMCTFQESYHPDVYKKFMGTTTENPRSNFTRRLQNFDRAAAAGMRSANPGVLVGLNPDLTYEMLALLAHCHHLENLGMTTYVSLPRLRKASGAPHSAGVGDDEFFRLIAVLSAGIPKAKLVISTRESPKIQQKLLPIIDVLTPGSPGVAPYTLENARFEVEASQFEVADHRPFEEILGECLRAGAKIDGYEPTTSTDLNG